MESDYKFDAVNYKMVPFYSQRYSQRNSLYWRETILLKIGFSIENNSIMVVLALYLYSDSLASDKSYINIQKYSIQTVVLYIAHKITL